MSLATIVGLLLGTSAIVALTTYGAVWVYDRGIAAWTERRRLRSLLHSGRSRDNVQSLSDRLDALWTRVNLPGTPVEWVLGIGVLFVGAVALAQASFHSAVMDIGVPLDTVAFAFWVVQKMRQRTYDRLMGEMSTALHVVATEYNVRKNVSTALQYAYPRMPPLPAQHFLPTIRMLTSGVAPAMALEQLGKDVGRPYGVLFARTLQKGLTSASIDRLLVQIATMTEQWNVRRKESRAAVALQQLIGTVLNVGFFVVAVVVPRVLPQVGAYNVAHPFVYVPGVVSVGIGFVIATVS